MDVVQICPTWNDDGEPVRFQRLIDVPDPPCDGCQLRPVCEQHRLACPAFSQYVSNKRSWNDDAPREPTAKIYARIYD